MVDEKIFEKIQKLLALANSANENEAMNAMAKAQALMAKHNLEMRQFEDVKVEKEIVTTTSDEYSTAPWKRSLAKVVADNFKCKLFYYNLQGKMKMAFMGLKEDSAICAEIYKYSIKVIMKGRDKAYDFYYNQGIKRPGVRGDYTIGFIKGLNDRFEEQKRANTEWALVLVVDPEVEEKYNNMTFKTFTSNARTQTSGDAFAKNMGYQDGKNFSTDKKLGGK